MKTVATLAAVFLMLATLLSVLPTHGEGEIYDAVIRLHVLAASDSAGDQQNKLAVRDAILPVAAAALEGCESRAAAAARLRELIPQLEEIAAARLRELDAPAPVTVTLGQESYPTRAYEGFCFPAGEYLSLRVVIGSGEGANWWCVLFPSLCLSVAEGGRREELEEAFVAVGLTPEQYRVITESDESTTYRLRFKLLEVLSRVRDRVRAAGAVAE